VAEIGLILYLTFKEIFKKTGDTFVLKDEYTIYFVTLVVICLFFKILIIDALLKEEIRTKNSCSMFLSTYVPEFFLTLAYTCIAIKSIFLYLNIKDSKETYQRRNRKRKQYADIALIIYLAFLMAVMFLRCMNTCQADMMKEFFSKNLPFVASRKLISAITILKTIPLLVISVLLVMLCRTEMFFGKKPIIQIAVGQILITAVYNLFNVFRFEQSDPTRNNPAKYFLLNARYSQYVSIFFVDMFMIFCLMLTLVVLRQVESQVLVALGVYKNVEHLTDKEMISEYEKLKKQSLKLQRRIRRQARQKKNNTATSSILTTGNEDNDDSSSRALSLDESVRGSFVSNNRYRADSISSLGSNE
jgi:hypothetical protein